MEDVAKFKALPKAFRDHIGGNLNATSKYDLAVRLHLMVNFVEPFVKAGSLPDSQRTASRRKIKDEAAWGLGEKGQKLGVFVAFKDMNPFNPHRGCDAVGCSTMEAVGCLHLLPRQRLD